jgi:oligoribonuclease
MLAWLDIETTGLNPQTDAILEIGFILTDDALNEIARRAWVLPLVSDVHLDDFIKKMHGPKLHPLIKEGGSGLIDVCVGVWINATGNMFRKAADEIGVFLREHLKGEKPPLCGSSVDFDRSFLRASGTFAPILDLFHYRVVDVSTVKEMARRWAPLVYETRPKDRNIHRALPDLEDTIAEAKHYKKYMFDIHTVGFKDKNGPWVP